MGRYFGLIPAAGRSKRMGEQKLLMPWSDHKVIDSVVSAWNSSRVEEVLFVVREDSEPLREAINVASGVVENSRAGAGGASLCVLESDTPDMKSTIQQGLLCLQERWQPQAEDWCLIAPADLPRISSQLIDRVIAESHGDKIVVPVYGEKIGHPVAFPWPMTNAIFELAADEGINAMFERCPVKKIKFDSELRVRDIDTPEDYDRERRNSGG